MYLHDYSSYYKNQNSYNFLIQYINKFFPHQLSQSMEVVWCILNLRSHINNPAVKIIFVIFNRRLKLNNGRIIDISMILLFYIMIVK